MCTTGTKSLNFPYAIINAAVQEEEINIAYDGPHEYAYKFSDLKEYWSLGLI